MCENKWFYFSVKCDCKSRIFEWWMKNDRRFQVGFQGKAIRKRRNHPKGGMNAEEKVVCSEKRISQNSKNSLNQKVFCYELGE